MMAVIIVFKWLVQQTALRLNPGKTVEGNAVALDDCLAVADRSTIKNNKNADGEGVL